MGKVMSIVARKANRFNAENRAHRFLDTEKLPTAPKFESTIEDMKRTLEINPKYIESISKKDASLDHNLKNVYVTSENIYSEYGIKRREDLERKLPLERQTPDEFDYGFQEPDRVTRGRCTLRQAIAFITEHQMNPNKNTIKSIAEQYKMKETVVENILKYYRNFMVYIPHQKVNDAVLFHDDRKFIEEKNDKST